MEQRIGSGVAVVTGGSSGIGKRCAAQLAAMGYRVYVLARSGKRLEKALEKLKNVGPVQGIVCDVTDGTQLEEAARRLRDEEGKVDMLLCSHGIMDLAPVRNMPLASFETMMEINYLGTVAVVKRFLPLIQRGGGKRIVLISSLAAKIAPPYFGAYAASKAAVSSFVHALRQELKSDGIQVMSVHPGPVDTPLIDGYIDGDYYPLPPGVPVVSAEKAAVRITKKAAGKRMPRELFIPGRFKLAAMLAFWWPGAVDLVYAAVTKKNTN